jgi:hypothetical protein
MDKAIKKSAPKISRNSGIVIGLFIVILLFGASFVYVKARQGYNTYYTYENFEFRKVSGLWVTEIYDPDENKVYSLPLHYGPRELEDIHANPGVNKFLELAALFRGPKNTSATYVTYDPDINDSQISLAYYELSRHLDGVFAVETLPAVIHDVQFIENETIRTCENTDEPVIYLGYNSPAYVDFRGNCLVIQGEGTDLVKSVDRTLYAFYNIMK